MDRRVIIRLPLKSSFMTPRASQVVLVVKNLPANAGDVRHMGLIPEWKRQPTPVFLPGKSHGQRSLVDYSPWGHNSVGHNLATKQ